MDTPGQPVLPHGGDGLRTQEQKIQVRLVELFGLVADTDIGAIRDRACMPGNRWFFPARSDCSKMIQIGRT